MPLQAVVTAGELRAALEQADVADDTPVYVGEMDTNRTAPLTDTPFRGIGQQVGVHDTDEQAKVLIIPVSQSWLEEQTRTFCRTSRNRGE